MALAIPFIDAILESDLKAAFKQRHTAHQIWERLRVEMPACDIGESTVRAYVRVRNWADVFSDCGSLDDAGAA